MILITPLSNDIFEILFNKKKVSMYGYIKADIGFHSTGISVV